MNDLTFTTGGDNLAGLVDQIYHCPTADIASVPALAAAASLKTAASAIVCKTGKKFQMIYFTDETAKLDVKSVGERDGKGRESMVTFRFPKLGVALHDVIRQLQNTPCVIIFKMMDGKFYLLGVTQLDIASAVLSLAPPAYFEQADSTSGEKRADLHGALFGFKYTSSHDPIEYASTVPLTPAP
jgi:hypothetical protein